MFPSILSSSWVLLTVSCIWIKLSLSQTNRDLVQSSCLVQISSRSFHTWTLVQTKREGSDQTEKLWKSPMSPLCFCWQRWFFPSSLPRCLQEFIQYLYLSCHIAHSYSQNKYYRVHWNNNIFSISLFINYKYRSRSGQSISFWADMSWVELCHPAITPGLMYQTSQTSDRFKGDSDIGLSL